MLRGIGATIALPFLDAMIPALTPIAKAVGAPIQRFAGVFAPLGMRPGYWTPPTTGSGFELTPILQSLAPVKEYVTVVSQLYCQYGGHGNAGAGWMSGGRPAQEGSQTVRCATTLDQAIAEKIQGDTPLPSIEMAGEEITAYTACGASNCVFANTISWKNPTTPLPMEANPRNVFQRLFGTPGTVDQRRRRLREDRSILDSIVNDDLTLLHRQVGARDRSRVDEYLTYLREVEQRVQKLETAGATTLDLPDPPIGVQEVWSENMRLMYDFLALAWQADITRVASFMTAHEGSKLVFTNLGHTDAWHPMTHNGGDPEKWQRLLEINVYEMELFSAFLRRLKQTPDGDGSLLDHCLILFGSGMGEADTHSPMDVPTLVVGGHSGRLKGWRHIETERATPLANVLSAVANKFDLQSERFGELATGAVEL